MKAVQQVIGVESVKPGTNKPVSVKSEPAVVESKLGNGEPTKAAGFTSFCEGSKDGDC